MNLSKMKKAELVKVAKEMEGKLKSLAEDNSALLGEVEKLTGEVADLNARINKGHKVVADMKADIARKLPRVTQVLEFAEPRPTKSGNGHMTAVVKMNAILPVTAFLYEVKGRKFLGSSVVVNPSAPAFGKDVEVNVDAGEYLMNHLNSVLRRTEADAKRKTIKPKA